MSEKSRRLLTSIAIKAKRIRKRRIKPIKKRNRKMKKMMKRRID